MADEAESESKIDVENMKVAELKKKLKDFGLPISGNKSELIERLQQSIHPEKNNTTSNPGELESASSELDSSLLNDGSKLNFSSAGSEDKNSAKTCNNELPASPEKSKEASNATNALKPLKKRFVAETSAGVSEQKPKEKKKIVLNRNHVPTPKFIPNKPAEPLKTKNVVTFDESDFTKSKNSKEEIASNNPIKEGSNKINLKAAKNISENERITMRAKRFNIITAPESISKSGKIIITSKKNQVSHVTSTNSSTATADKVSLTPLQKRALRFGFDVPKMTQLQQEKGPKRKLEIGKGIISAEDQEKRKKRAERFGII